MGELVYAEDAYAIQGAIFEVYGIMGSGFLEPVYQECLEKELALRDIPFTAQQQIPITYKGEVLSQFYKADIICYDKIILELKAVKNLLAEHTAQLHNYLHATNMKLGLLVNFAHYPGVEIKRVIV